MNREKLLEKYKDHTKEYLNILNLLSTRRLVISITFTVITLAILITTFVITGHPRYFSLVFVLSAVVLGIWIVPRILKRIKLRNYH